MFPNDRNDKSQMRSSLLCSVPLTYPKYYLQKIIIKHVPIWHCLNNRIVCPKLEQCNETFVPHNNMHTLQKFGVSKIVYCF